LRCAVICAADLADRARAQGEEGAVSPARASYDGNLNRSSRVSGRTVKGLVGTAVQATGTILALVWTSPLVAGSDAALVAWSAGAGGAQLT
jgi:hypothetical protein